MKGLILVAGAATAFFLLRNKSFINKATYTFEKMKIDTKAKRIKVRLGVINPTGASLMINAITGNLILNGQDVGSVQSFNKTRITSVGKSFIDLDLQPRLTGIATAAKNILSRLFSKTPAPAKKGSAMFNGSINVNGSAFPLRLNLLS